MYLKAIMCFCYCALHETLELTSSVLMWIYINQTKYTYQLTQRQIWISNRRLKRFKNSTYKYSTELKFSMIKKEGYYKEFSDHLPQIRDSVSRVDWYVRLEF